MDRRFTAGRPLHAGCQDVPGFIATFSGSHHYIVDYLADEVLKRLDEQTRLFLLQTSILSKMCASLCNSLVESMQINTDWMDRVCWKPWKR